MDSAMESVSVVICSYNRAAYLSDTLRTLAAALEPHGNAVEVLVVNNASTDSTEEVVSAFIKEHPLLTVRLVREERQGLSFARNAGLAQARGSVVCFLDDDVYVSEGWLAGILKAFTLGERIGCVAGRTRLQWPDVPRPGWLDHTYVGILSEWDFGDRSFVMGKEYAFVGANFALSREAVSAIGAFDPELGRKRNILLSGEDTDYAQRLLGKGFSIAYSAEAYIHHRLFPEQMTYSWFCRRFFWNGVTTYFLRRQWYYPITGVPRLLSCFLLLLVGVLTFSPKRIILSSFRVLSSAGAFYAWYLRPPGRAQT